MHTIWKGSINFGMVHIPVKLYSALEDRDIPLHYIHKACGSPIRNVRKCNTCETEVEWNEIGRGYECEKDRIVILEKDELDLLVNNKSKQAHIYEFVKESDVDPMYVEKTYFLGPDQLGVNAYNLFLRALKSTAKAAVCNITIRSKTHLALIRAKENCLLLELLHYADEVRDIKQVPNLIHDYQVKRKELLLAKQLIAFMTNTFEPTNYHDEYRVQLTKLIEQKLAGEKFVPHVEATESNIVDLLTALQESIRSLDEKDNTSPSKVKTKQKMRVPTKKKNGDGDIAESVS